MFRLSIRDVLWLTVLAGGGESSIDVPLPKKPPGTPAFNRPLQSAHSGILQMGRSAKG